MNWQAGTSAFSPFSDASILIMHHETQAWNLKGNALPSLPRDSHHHGCCKPLSTGEQGKSCTYSMGVEHKAVHGVGGSSLSLM